METQVKLTKLAKCAGCGAKVGAGTLSRLLADFPAHFDERLIVGFDKSDDASVYVISDETALVQTIDFFPPIVDDAERFGRIAAANAISDVYAMGGTPKLALNVMCVTAEMDQTAVQGILRGGYQKAYEAGVIITGGHTIEGSEPMYGLSVSGFVHPRRVLKNSGARPGDVLVLTKPLGIGILTTAAKAEMADAAVMERIYRQMETLNKTAAEVMVTYPAHSCTDVTGFGLMGHSFEMAQGSEVSIHLMSDRVPYHAEAFEMAEMGLIPAGAYKNRAYVADGYARKREIPLALEDILFDPQTSGGLLIALPERSGEAMCAEMRAQMPCAEIVGYVTEREDKYLVIE